VPQLKRDLFGGINLILAEKVLPNKVNVDHVVGVVVAAVDSHTVSCWKADLACALAVPTM
jgi:hypothetical protein